MLFLMLFFASAAASPLYPVYQVRFGFSGAFRMTIALATPSQSAGLVTAIFTVGYLAFSVPALIAGVATTTFGLHPTALVYSASPAALVAVAAGILLSGPRRTATRQRPPSPPVSVGPGGAL